MDNLSEIATLPPLLKGRKVSVTFMDYCEPYLASLLNDKVDPTLEEIQNIFLIPWCVWNSIVLNKRQDNNEYTQMLDSLLNKAPIEAKMLVDFLRERKERDFGQYNYMLGQYSLYVSEPDQEMRLRISARRVPPPV